MKCVIIAAGQGSRLRTIAPSKPLARICGVPLIERVIRSALAGGASGFVVVTGYEAAPLEAFLGELSHRLGVEIECVFNPDWRASNGLSVVAAAETAGERFLLSMSDHLYDPVLVSSLMAAARRRPGLVLAVDRRLDNPLVDLDDVTMVATDREGGIVRIGKHLPTYDAFDTGVFVVPRALAQAVREDVAAGGPGSLSAGVQRLADQGLAHVHDIGSTFWLDVDDPAAFAHAERELQALA